MRHDPTRMQRAATLSNRTLRPPLSHEVQTIQTSTSTVCDIRLKRTMDQLLQLRASRS